MIDSTKVFHLGLVGALSILLIVKFIPTPLKKTIPYMKMILKLLPGARKNTSGY